MKLDALYPALGCTVRSELAKALGASCTENGNLLVDDHQRTSIEGLYAVGDVVTDLHQLSVAFGHAAIAATDIHNRLPSNLRRTKNLGPKGVRRSPGELTETVPIRGRLRGG